MAAREPDAPLSVPEAILQRRNVRHFLPDPVPPDLLDRLVELTAKAPSSWNFQPWRIVLVRDPARREQLCEACFRQPQVREAPVTFVFAVSDRGWRDTLEEVLAIAHGRGAWTPAYQDVVRRIAPGAQQALGPRLREYNVKDATIAATHLVLAAESLGFGTCYMNGFDEERVKELIGAGGDPDVGIALVLAIGAPRERGPDPGRLPLERTVFAEDLRTPWRGATPQTPRGDGSSL